MSCCQAVPMGWVMVGCTGESLLVMINDVTRKEEQLSLFYSIFSWGCDGAVDLQYFSEDLGLPEHNQV